MSDVRWQASGVEFKGIDIDVGMMLFDQGLPLLVGLGEVRSQALSMLGPRFDDHDRFLLVTLPPRNQCAAVDARVRVDDGFDRFGKDWALGSPHAVAFATAEPKAIGAIEVADISHAMPDLWVATGSLIEDFVELILIGACDVAMCHARAMDHQFADLAWCDFTDLVDR